MKVLFRLDFLVASDAEVLVSWVVEPFRHLHFFALAPEDRSALPHQAKGPSTWRMARNCSGKIHTLGNLGHYRTRQKNEQTQIHR
jgi:hypothetical protein